jgi:threonine/homoserine/homoserine lactone efflux protein
MPVIAVLAGVAMGFVGSIPAAGPLLLLVVASGLSAERKQALALAAGGALAESGYVLLAFWGLSGLLDRYAGLVIAMRLSSGLLLLALGVLALAPRRGGIALEKPARAAGFAIGFSLVALNPAFLLTWSGIAAAAYTLGWLDPRAGLAPYLAVGTFFGIVIWFACVAWLAEKNRERFRPESLQKITRGVGVLLVAMAAWLFYRALEPS